MKKLLARGAILGAVVGSFYLTCVHYTDSTHVAIAWDWGTGNIWLDDKPGWSFTPPWVTVSRIDTRPNRVCITSSSRAFGCKLVQFEPAAYGEFVRVEGFRYYWWANRISFNLGHDKTYRGMSDILRGYTYGAKQYPFVRVLREFTEP